MLPLLATTMPAVAFETTGKVYDHFNPPPSLSGAPGGEGASSGSSSGNMCSNGSNGNNTSGNSTNSNQTNAEFKRKAGKLVAQSAVTGATRYAIDKFGYKACLALMISPHLP